MSTPQKREFDERQLRQYLLGALPEAEVELLDELSIADDEMALRLRAAENDLVDAYACGELSGDTLARFQSFYLSSAIRREKAKFAAAFRSFPDRPAPRRVAGGQSWQSWFRMAAGVTLLAGSYLLYQNFRLRNELSQTETARVGLEKRGQELESQLASEHSTAEARKALESARESLPQPKPHPAAAIPAFLLLPPTRGLGGLTPVALPAGTERIDFEMRLESDEFPDYRVALKDPGTGQVLWHSGKLKAVSRGGDKGLLVRTPANLLKPQNYILEVTGGASEIIGGYPVRITIN